MIRIRVARRTDGMELTAVGHAEYASRGRDVVCAGISALLYGFVAYLEGLSPLATVESRTDDGEYPHLEVTEGDGVLRVRTRSLGSRDWDGFAVTEAGLCLIAAAYPDFVTLEKPLTQEGERYEST